ncbi:MAG: UDP-N-acetylmuramate--L-alanine ligase [Bacteroidetes bacterium GWF2_29_10]|nr:MAG: UDP-N-acetylmuramate--L-alanine ligase [Bacteroidetes bacterium GWF2_29_10]
MENRDTNILFLGIGGIGMSAIARYYKCLNYNVYGYDKTQTTLTEALIKEGINVFYEDSIDYFPKKLKFVVYTPAVPKVSNIYNYLERENYKIYKRAEILGLITKDAFTIAVAGSHGKTTISSIIAHILKQAGVNVFGFIGGIMCNYKSNLIMSDINKPKIFVVEADEYDRSFLQLSPNISVISSIDTDHLDIYKNIKNIELAFNEFASKIKDNGILITNKRIKNINVSQSIKNYTYSTSDIADFQAKNIIIDKNGGSFDFVSSDVVNISTFIHGEHNIENITAALSVAKLMNIDVEIAKKAVSEYKGVKRRFEYIINTEKIVYIDDYAHHPEELKKIIKSLKKIYKGKKITGIFQPHLYSRTKDLYKEFADSLNKLDEVILLDIYPAREEPIEGVSSQIIYDRLKCKKHLSTKEKLLSHLNQLETDVLVTFGAGDIDSLIIYIKKFLITKYL